LIKKKNKKIESEQMLNQSSRRFTPQDMVQHDDCRLVWRDSMPCGLLRQAKALLAMTPPKRAACKDSSLKPCFKSRL